MIDRLPFGRTGHQSTRIIFGAAAFFSTTPERSERVLATLLEHGINHIDTAAGYGDSELHLAPWMKRHRRDFFLATKTGERTYDGAKRSIERSLRAARGRAVSTCSSSTTWSTKRSGGRRSVRAARSKRRSRRAIRAWCGSSA